MQETGHQAGHHQWSRDCPRVPLHPLASSCWQSTTRWLAVCWGVVVLVLRGVLCSQGGIERARTCHRGSCIRPGHGEGKGDEDEEEEEGEDEEDHEREREREYKKHACMQAPPMITPSIMDQHQTRSVILQLASLLLMIKVVAEVDSHGSDGLSPCNGHGGVSPHGARASPFGS